MYHLSLTYYCMKNQSNISEIHLFLKKENCHCYVLYCNEVFLFYLFYLVIYGLIPLYELCIVSM